MPCNEWRDDWIAQLYDELPAEEQRTFDEHLANCAACRETMRELDESRRILADSSPPIPELPRVLVLRPNRARHAVWSFALGATAAMLIFFLWTFLFSPDTELLENRIAQLEATPVATPVEHHDGEILTRAQFDEEMLKIAKRHQRQRAEDLDYLVRYLTASEQRNGAFMDRTQEALAYLALRGDPRLSER